LVVVCENLTIIRLNSTKVGKMSGQTTAPPQGAQQADGADQHEQDVEGREAYQYWGYLFKSDKTGSDRLKSLLRGLKDKMVSGTTVFWECCR